MNTLNYIKENLLIPIGWIYLFLLASLFVSLGLIKLIVFLLFIYLVSDLIINGIGNHIPYFSKRFMLYITSIFIVSVFIIILITIIPKTIKDFPSYTAIIEKTLNEQLTILVHKYNINLDIIDFKSKSFDWMKQNVRQTFNILQTIGKNIFLFLLAIIINFVIIQNTIKKRSKSSISDLQQNNLYSYFTNFTMEKINVFYNHFKMVMSAQLIISIINTILTIGILFVLQIPYKSILIVFVFIFGLLPVIGNIISNILICSAALIWAGFWQFIAALTFLVVIHKLEYFLNSKIIGHFTSLPIYITLLALIIGELLFHISGMILAVPTVLFFRGELKAIMIKPDK